MTDYLWDKTGPPDPDVERLERALGLYRYRGDGSARRRRAPRPWQWGLGLAAVFAAGVGIGWVALRLTLTAGPIEVQSVQGPVQIDRRAATAGATLAEGSWLQTQAAAKVQLRVGDIGHVTVYAHSRLGLEQAGLVRRLALDYGKIDALITAPPRYFVVNTPSATAVDLGCAYRLEVDRLGNGLISVALGSVVLERRRPGYEAFVPEGAACRVYTGTGPGVPFFQDATARFKSTIERFEKGPSEPDALAALLAAASPRDAMSLWHVLWLVPQPQRRDVAARMIELTGEPPDADPNLAVQLDPHTMQAWWDDLERGW